MAKMLKRPAQRRGMSSKGKVPSASNSLTFNDALLLFSVLLHQQRLIGHPTNGKSDRVVCGILSMLVHRKTAVNANDGSVIKDTISVFFSILRRLHPVI
jgi:hypothetical protein